MNLSAGSCRKPSCPFLHIAAPNSQPEHKQSQNSTPISSQPPNPSPQANKPCNKCGGEHSRKMCNFNGKCTWCGRDGHKEEVCHQKKAGKPKILFSISSQDYYDGVEIKANLLLCENAAKAKAGNFNPQCKQRHNLRILFLPLPSTLEENFITNTDEVFSKIEGCLNKPSLKFWNYSSSYC